MPDENFDEQTCLRRIADGNESAARELLRHFHPFVFKLVRAHLPRRLPAEDLVQMTFIKIFQNLDRYSGKVPLEHWISRVTVNTCLNELRAEKRRPEWRLADFDEETSAAIERLAQIETDFASPDDARVARDLVEQMLAQLSPNDRLIITLLHLEERSVDEIHELTGWSRAKIKVRAFRARARMKKMLGPQQTAALIFA
ncbi:MAG TPA: sigma-70 family RNA polymerase sigma factor [Chthoniobacterales bacterium]|jgi:RNA polymerase sigma-70 factor (ECF subfamily)